MKTTKVVRFDWAMKKLLRNKASFEILEGFLTTLLEKEVTILQMLESESNKESREDKSNRVDLLAELEGGEVLLVEVQVERQTDYFHRMTYGASKLIVDYMDEGFAYDKVKRVVSVNIVYFDLGQGKDYVYHGGTEFRGIHCGDVLGLSEAQRKSFPELEKVSEVFPEYYLLKVNEFDDYAKNSLDEWIYFFKNSEVRGEFRAKGLKKAAQEWDVMKLDKEARREYDGFLKDWRIATSEVMSSFVEGQVVGEKVGIKKGEKKGLKKGEKIGIEKGEKIGIEKRE